MNFNNGTRDEAYDPNRIEPKPFPHETMGKLFERVFGYRDGRLSDNIHDHSAVVAYEQYFSNQLGAVATALTEHALNSDWTYQNRQNPFEVVTFTYTFEERCDIRQNLNRPHNNTLVAGFRNSDLFAYLIAVGIGGEDFILGEVERVTNHANCITISFKYKPPEFIAGMTQYAEKLRRERDEEDFREAVNNINLTVVPKLLELHKLGVNLNDIDKIFNMVSDLHETFVKPKGNVTKE